MVTTNNKNYWSKMWSYKDHGKNWETVYKNIIQKGFRWLHEFWNKLRMTEMQAAIGRVPIKKVTSLAKFVFNMQIIFGQTARKTGILYAPVFSNFENNNDNTSYTLHAAYKCYVFVRGIKKLRDKIMEEINNKGIPCISGSCPEVYMEKLLIIQILDHLNV